MNASFRRAGVTAAALAFFMAAACMGWNWLAYDSFIQLTFPHYRLPPDAPVLRVLFLGNSYVFVNDLPDMVATVAASDTAHPVDIRAGMFAVGNITLDGLWENPAAHASLAAGKWDFVVLQEHSRQALSPEGAADAEKAAGRWNGEIGKSGARPVLYQVWARRPGSAWYDRTIHPEADFGNPDSMRKKIDDMTAKIAAKIHAPAAPVGDGWAACAKQPGAPELYRADGSHPSIAGDYLAALLFYRALTGNMVDSVGYVPLGMKAAAAEVLKHCAAMIKMLPAPGRR